MKIRRVFCLLSISVLACLQASADFVDSGEARKIASEFFRNNQGDNVRQVITKSVTAADVELVYPAPATKGVMSDGSLPEFYIFNRSDGKGFVIVSAETGIRQILAHSDEDIFHTDQMDLGARPFLDSYRETVRDIRSGMKVRERHPSKPLSGNAPKKLTTAKFDQNGYSFNSKYAPKLNGKSCLSGCVATAMAIIMKYHQWPDHNSGSYSYTSKAGLSLSFDFAANPFYWNLMSDTPDAASSDAVSMLQKACGVAVRMEYGTNESSAYFALGGYALRHYFYYDYPLHLVRDYIDTESWDSIMHEEIDANRPVFIGGSSNSGGHAYVLDGYDDRDGTYHYNLGWGGANNGYYADGYISGNRYVNTDAIVGIKPRSDYSEDIASQLEYECVSYTFDGNLGSNSMFNVQASYLINCSNEPFGGQIGVCVYDRNFNLKYFISTVYDESSNPLDIGWYWSNYGFMHCYISENMEIEPTDMILLSTSPDAGRTWHPIYSSHPYMQPRHAGGYGYDAPHFSQMMFESDRNPLSVIETSITPGKPFDFKANGIYNFTMPQFKGDISLAICDTRDWSVVKILKSVHGSFDHLYGRSIIQFDDVVIPEDLNLQESYALSLVTVSDGSTNTVHVYDQNYYHCYLMLSDYMDVTGIISRMTDSDDIEVFSIDGQRRTSDSPQPGLYLIRHSNGQVTKELRRF